MHYSNQDGVLQALDPKRNFLMGQRIGLSFLDAKLANLAYKCSRKIIFIITIKPIRIIVSIKT